jgi:hypothetical protein
MNTGTYQQKDATDHINNISKADLRNISGEQTIRRPLRPAHSHDPTSNDCYLWGHLKYVS